jgi:hypothetical protein
VFAVSWESPEGVAIPMTNMGPKAVRVHVDLPPEEFNLDPRVSYSVRDIFNGKPVGKLGDISVQLAPLESALVVISKPAGGEQR